jgi:hypothetical protein
MKVSYCTCLIKTANMVMALRDQHLLYLSVLVFFNLVSPSYRDTTTFHSLSSVFLFPKTLHIISGSPKSKTSNSA